MRIGSCVLLTLVIMLAVILPNPPVYPSALRCYLNNITVQYPNTIGANQTFIISTSFDVLCSGSNTRLIKVEVFDGVDGSLLSVATYNRTSVTAQVFNTVRAPIITGYWYVTVRGSVVNVPTYGAIGRGFSIFVNS